MKYTANRCNRPFGDDMENKCFTRKADAIKWAKQCAFGKVRDQSKAERPVVFEKSNFYITSMR